MSHHKPLPRTPDGGNEPFPRYPSSPGPSSHQDNVQTSSTSTTTTTVLGGRNHHPITTTTSNQSQPGPSHTATPSTPSAYTTNDTNGGPYSRTEAAVPHQPVVRRRPIGIRRLPSATNRLSSGSDGDPPSRSNSGRGRSTSAPQPPHFTTTGGGSGRLTRQSTRQGPTQPDLPTLREESSQPQRMPAADTDHLMIPGNDGAADQQGTIGVGRRRRLSNAAQSMVSKLSSEDHGYFPPPHEYETEVVDLLDVIGMLSRQPIIDMY